MLSVVLMSLTGKDRPQPNWVDVIEVNHVVRDGKVTLTQVIYWRWESDNRLHVVAWRTVPEDYTVQRVGNRWIDEYQEGTQRMRVYGRGYRFRRSDYDPEMEDRKVWPVERRVFGRVRVLSKVVFGQPT